LNRMMSWHLPTNGPKTLSGLIIEFLEMIPQAGVSLKIANLGIEVLKVRGNAVKLVKVIEV
jgi:Mg2+/Co2+ transporter CorB